jgi:hypothetical protein
MRKAMIYVDGTNDYMGEVEVIQYKGANDVTVRLQDGTMCHAIDNPFTGLLYADPVYAKIEEV